MSVPCVRSMLPTFSVLPLFDRGVDSLFSDGLRSKDGTLSNPALIALSSWNRCDRRRFWMLATLRQFTQ